MIGSLKGRITAVYSPFVLVEVNGVGYEVETPVNTFCTLQQGDEVFLWIHMVVREDAQLLYGFADNNQRNLFRTLIKITGVGAKMAIAILSSIDLHTLKRIVTNDDVARFTKVPGIGKKTAERLLIELRGKLDHIMVAGGVVDMMPLEQNQSFVEENEAVEALQSLGYSNKEAEKAVAAVVDQGKSTQDYIRLALKFLTTK